MATADFSKLIRVRESLQNWIVLRRTEVIDDPAKDRIQQLIRVRDVQVQRCQFAIQMQLWLIIERVAVVIFQPLLQRPRDDVAQCVKVQVQIKRYPVIEPDAFVVDCVATDETETECDDFAILSPDEEPRALRHSLTDSEEIIFRQRLEF